MTATQKRKALAEILSGDLGFHDMSSSYASHAFHAFAAKFPPQLPRVFIERLTEPGETVLDPMMGSGTAIVEATLLGRRAVGADIDPLALRLCRVKTTPLSAERLRQAAQTAVISALALLMKPSALGEEIGRRFGARTACFLDYWFLPETRNELMALVMSIEEEPDATVRECLGVLFSSIIITKSGGVSLARDLAHSRPHRVLSKKPRNAIEQFEVRVRKVAGALDGLSAAAGAVEIHHADARHLPLADSSVDLVITSPPYANAIDYMRAHKFSLVWFGEPLDKLSDLRSTYVGSENCRHMTENGLPSETANRITLLAACDPRKARILQKYFGDMKRVLAEMLRVLRPGAAAGIVVGPSTMRGVRIETHDHLAEIAAQLGLEVVGIGERKLDRNRRMMPARIGNGAMNGIEQRMHEEFVIGLIKP